jgi:hypothetical protein
MNYKENPYCLGLHGNYAKEIYPCLKYVKWTYRRPKTDVGAIQIISLI